jgi:hypothetical protein
MEITITKYAARHNRSPVTVRQKALRGGFKTARRVGRDWLIDEDEPYTDNRLTAPPLPDLWQLTSGRRCDTISDAGAVKIANDSFSVLIPTGAGDGDSAFCIYNSGEIDTAPLNYFTLISGRFNIYDYDCGNTVAETVQGSFQVYYSSGIVFFIKA